jgi:predicted lipoprotein with Yx(FWY)xxD motif
MKRTAVTVSLFVGIAMFATACGGGSNSAVGSTPKKTTATAAATTTLPPTTVPAPATVTLGQTKVGAVLVDATGMTLYELDRDSAAAATCTGACATLWPPLTVTGSPVAGAGLDATKLATVSGANGTQVTYGGHPLYHFANDKVAGDVNGQGFAGGVWWVVGADGNKDTTMAAAAAPVAPATAAPTAPPATMPRATMPPVTMPPATMGSGY